jgi:DNA polymerase kappa
VVSHPQPGSTVTDEAKASRDTDHEIDAEEAFETAARQEVQEEMNDLEQLSQEKSDVPTTSAPEEPVALDTAEEPPLWDCPICGRPQIADDRGFNEHVDFCLSKQTIREVVQDTETTASLPSNTRKRKPHSQPDAPDADPKQKRLFFQ